MHHSLTFFLSIILSPMPHYSRLHFSSFSSINHSVSHFILSPLYLILLFFFFLSHLPLPSVGQFGSSSPSIPPHLVHLLCWWKCSLQTQLGLETS
ncbi:hypothetical protein RchiOBHm_Chr4g0437721 [Rosa chinensis]|uniref:Uncharacterized protein n=1 Tax=Rosa chinensis TaxID=74649 RepID=A0A2P6R2C9_ROSCH|nr:hypothetical protein RchiOBHm_Chr4g0437721 [Rosa chinensis]